MSLLDNKELKEVLHTKLDQILGESECEYLDNGGHLSIERRDYYFDQLVKYTKKLEALLEEFIEIGDGELLLNELRKLPFYATP